MNKKNRYDVFYYLDLLLPRFIAAIPYYLALVTLKIRLHKIEGIKAWHRNSFKKGNYVFGISDLDITVMSTEKALLNDSEKINSILKSHKKIFPFLGEVNFYIHGLVDQILPCLNYYEFIRDPELVRYIVEPINHNKKVEKIVFLLRMIFADRDKLKSFSYLRQKKWKGHFEDLELQTPKEINVDRVVNELVKEASLTPELEFKLKEAIYFIFNSRLNDQNIYQMQLPELWKFLFPHKYLWYEQGREENFDLIRGTILEEVCLRQLDWEIWGLMSQIPFLPDLDSHLIAHLNRQGKASLGLLKDSSLPLHIEKVIKMTLRYSSSQNSNSKLLK